MHFIRTQCIKRDYLNYSSDLWREKNCLLSSAYGKQTRYAEFDPLDVVSSKHVRWEHELTYKGASFTELKEESVSKWNTFPNNDAMPQSALLMNTSHLFHCVPLPHFLGHGSRVVQSKECHLLIKLFTTPAISWILIRRFLHTTSQVQIWWTHSSGWWGYIGTQGDDAGTLLGFPFAVEISALTDDALSPGFWPKVSLSIIFILSLCSPLVRWNRSGTDQQQRQNRSLGGAWEGEPGVPEKESLGGRWEGSAKLQGLGEEAGVYGGESLFFFFPSRFFPQRSCHPSPPPPWGDRTFHPPCQDP